MPETRPPSLTFPIKYYRQDTYLMSKENEFAQNYHFKGRWCIINSFIPYCVLVLNSGFFLLSKRTDQGIVSV